MLSMDASTQTSYIHYLDIAKLVVCQQTPLVITLCFRSLSRPYRQTLRECSVSWKVVLTAKFGSENPSPVTSTPLGVGRVVGAVCRAPRRPALAGHGRKSWRPSGRFPSRPVPLSRGGDYSEQLPNHQHRNLKAFEEHIKTHAYDLFITSN